ncbi:autotransporter outer membrane beta-barrel domain-containing protein [Phascolarctobacterium faecium]|uniref:autotransporter family protein n=1 Tax=Phascolarctobacterium faecium TaxID=33025 RepID=UPI003F749ECD
MMKNKDLSKKVLLSLLAISCAYPCGILAFKTAEATDSIISSDNDTDWRKIAGKYEFKDDQNFVFSDGETGVNIAGDSEFYINKSLDIKLENSKSGDSIGASVKSSGAFVVEGNEIHLTGDGSKSGGYAYGLKLHGTGQYDGSGQGSAYAEFNNKETYISAIVNSSGSISGSSSALNVQHNGEAVFYGNAYLNTQIDGTGGSGTDSILHSSASHVEFNGDRAILSGYSIKNLHGVYLHGFYDGNVMQERTNQLKINSKEASINVIGAGTTVNGIYGHLGYADITDRVENFSIYAKAIGDKNSNLYGIDAFDHEIVDIQAQNTIICTHSDSSSTYNNIALEASGQGNIDIGGSKAVISSSGNGSKFGKVKALYVNGSLSGIDPASGVTSNECSDITINADDITIIASTTSDVNEVYAAHAQGGDVDATIHVNSNAKGENQGKTVKVIGDIKVSTTSSNKGGSSKIFFNFDTKESYFKGKTECTVDSIKDELNIGLYNSALWDMTDDSNVTKLELKNDAIVDMRADGNAYSKLTVKNMTGNGGIIRQDIDVRSMKSDKVFVKKDFSGTQVLDIYQKDDYVPAGEEEGKGLVLASVNGNGVFTAKDREGTLFYTHYDIASKKSNENGFTTDWYLNKISKTNEPTTSVETALSANSLNYHTWRTENDKLLQRMGELRHNGEEVKGAWFRVKGSKIGRDGKFGFENKYTAYELGYDEVTKRTEEKTRYQGAAISYTDGSSSYSRGGGDNSSKAISFYNTEIGSKGHYLDLVFKISNMDNDFTVYDTNSKKITGDFNNTGVALSAEYGRKNALKNGWYIEPQAQFTLGYLGGDNYITSNGIEVNQSGIKSAVGRIGFNIGKEIGSKGIVYAKANLLHEFGGGYDVTMTDSTGRVKVSDSFNDTWFEYGIGAAFASGKNSHVYFDVERSAGSDFTKNWQWNIGARWNF